MAATGSPVDIGTLIYSRADLHGGKPCIAGTGMTVQAVAIYYNGGMSAEQLHEEFPHIPLSHMHAAIAYYLANRPAIDARIAEDEREGERLEAEYRRSPQATAAQRRD
ncbi:MAG: DUF433 domain-containing protein [Chloroflexi bacterium]|nr:DUF433 domain-containing protein [Chloroflexota bacterium]